MCNVYETTVQFGAEAENESFARVVVAGFMARVNPTLEELRGSYQFDNTWLQYERRNNTADMQAGRK